MSFLNKLSCGDINPQYQRSNSFQRESHNVDCAGERYSNCYSDSETINKATLLKGQLPKFINPDFYNAHLEYQSSDNLSQMNDIINSNTTEKNRKTIEKKSRTQKIRKTPREPSKSNGYDTFRLSLSSVATNSTILESNILKENLRKQAFEQWLSKKEAEKQHKEYSEQMARSQPRPQTTPEQREESYRLWLERKNRQEKEMREREKMLKLRNERRERERALMKAAEKEEKLISWQRQKEIYFKEMKEREFREKGLQAALEEKRRIAGERAYRDWLTSSKYKPRPVPLNQGELSMRGTTSEIYINPVDWKES